MANNVAVVLAAGKGTRMKSELPKVAVPLLGRPLLLHVLDALVKAGISRIVIVVGYKKEIVQNLVSEYRGVSIAFAEQNLQRGTADAVLAAQSALADFSGNLLVTCGDMPAIRPATFRRVLDILESDGCSMALLSARLETPGSYGRIVRNAEGQVDRIVEEKDASPEVKAIQEVNAGTYVFRAPEIFSTLKQVGTSNAQNEYYLTDAVALYRNQNCAVSAVVMEDASEVLGVNSPNDLELLAEKMAS